MHSLPHNQHQFSSVTQSCLTLCNPMNRSMPGFPVHHQLPEFTQTHVHWVSDAIQPSHPLSSPSPPPSIFPSIRVFSNESTLCMRWPKYWSFSFSISPSNEYPGLVSFRMDWLDFFGRNDAKAKTPVLWPTHAKSWLIGKDFDAGRDWGQEERSNQSILKEISPGVHWKN